MSENEGVEQEQEISAGELGAQEAQDNGNNGGDGGDEGAAAAQAGDGGEQPAYEPNYKLKVMDQEKEIPEKFRQLMQDAETEKEVREIFEKAYGLEFAKPKHEALQQTFAKVQSEHNYLLGSIQDLREAYTRGDLDTFFQKLQIPKERILQYALDKVNYEQLPPDQKQLLDSRRNAEIQAMQLQKQNQTLQQQIQTQTVQARQYALESELAGPELKSMVDSFDQRFGRPGAFRNEVINRGQLAWFQSQGKVDLTPRQAVQEVIRLYGLDQQQAAAAPVTPPESGGARPRVSTIPNVGSGRSASPLKQKPRSIEDLKKLAAEM
jgi:hypothetical protein